MSEKQKTAVGKTRFVGGRQTVFGYEFYGYRPEGTGEPPSKEKLRVAAEKVFKPTPSSGNKSSLDSSTE